MLFHEMGLSEELIKATAHMGFEEPTPIQMQTIPLSLAGKDVIGQAQTGTGKTAAYGIPMVEKMTMKVILFFREETSKTAFLKASNLLKIRIITINKERPSHSCVKMLN